MREQQITKFSIIITAILIVGFGFLCAEGIIDYCKEQTTRALIRIIVFGAVFIIQILDIIQRIKIFKNQE